MDHVWAYANSRDEDDALMKACQFALERLKKAGYVKQEAYDASLGLGVGTEREQYRLQMQTRDLIVKQGTGILSYDDVMAEAHVLKGILGVE